MQNTVSRVTEQTVSGQDTKDLVRAEMWTYRGTPEVHDFTLCGLEFYYRGAGQYWALDEDGNRLGPFSLYIGTDGTFNMYKMIRAD